MSILLLALLWITQTSEAQIEQSFRAGQQALKGRDFELAATEFKKVLALDPTIVEAEVNLGLAYQGLFDYASAAHHLEKALRERPNLLGPTVLAGMDYLKLGSPEKAIPFLQRALKLDTSNLDAREALAASYLAQENIRSAAEQFRQMATLDPDKAEALFKLGHEYLDLAARLAYRGARLYPESAWGHRFLGDLLLQRGRWKEASEEYGKALASEPSQPGLHASLGMAYLQARKLEEADTEFHRELALDSRDETAWLGLANTQLARGQALGALGDLRKIWEISPEFLAAQQNFPSVELSRESAEGLIAAVREEPESAAKHFLSASLFAAVSDNASAEREWNSLQHDLSARRAASNTAAKTHTDKTVGENAEASYWLARNYLAQGAEAFAQLQATFPDSWRTHQLRAEDYALRQDVEDATKEFHAALELRPMEPALHEALGELYLNHHKNEDAKSELERALELDPSRTRTLSLLGRLYLQERDNEKALPYLERAVRIQPNLTEASSLLGTVYVRLGQFASAVPRLEKAAAVDHYGNVHYELYLTYRALGRTELARKALARSQALRRSSLEHDQALVLGSPPPESEAQ